MPVPLNQKHDPVGNVTRAFAADQLQTLQRRSRLLLRTIVELIAVFGGRQPHLLGTVASHAAEAMGVVGECAAVSCVGMVFVLVKIRSEPSRLTRAETILYHTHAQSQSVSQSVSE